MMKLYMHPASTTSRPIMLFALDRGLEVEPVVVDIKSGENLLPWYAEINPNRMVPVLQDGEFRLTESSAILKYLADKFDAAEYPKPLQARARVNEALDWFASNFARTFVYGFCYPQLVGQYKLPDEDAQRQALELGKRGAVRFLAVLDQHMLSADKPWLCGDQLTIADYYGSGFISLGEVIGCAFSAYPNVTRWYGRMKARANWAKANAGIRKWAELVRASTFMTV